MYVYVHASSRSYDSVFSSHHILYNYIFCLCFIYTYMIVLMSLLLLFAESGAADSSHSSRGVSLLVPQLPVAGHW